MKYVSVNKRVIKTIFKGNILHKDDMIVFKNEFMQAASQLDSFFVLCVMECALDEEAKQILEEVQMWATQNGYIASVVVAPIAQTIQMRRVAQKRGIDKIEKYIAINDPNKREKIKEHFSSFLEG